MTEIEYQDSSYLCRQLTGLFQGRHRPWWQLRGAGLLNRRGVTLSKVQMINFGVERPHVGFKWKRDDRKTKNWYPQGITGLGRQRQKFVVISWYSTHAPNRGARLSFVDVSSMSDVRYRHVLLVQPRSWNTFGPIEIHAGGLATRGHLIYVADSSRPRGIRVFDTRYLFPALANRDKDKCGLIQGNVYAYDYRLILPQIGKYILGGPKPSYLSTDWSDPLAVRLITGNYHSTHKPKYSNPPAKVAWWNLDGDKIVSLYRQRQTNVHKTQGAAHYKGTLWLSVSGREASLRVARSPYTEFKIYKPWPHGTEDLYASKKSSNLWCLTEHPDGGGDHRFVFAVRRRSYGP